MNEHGQTKNKVQVLTIFNRGRIGSSQPFLPKDKVVALAQTRTSHPVPTITHTGRKKLTNIKQNTITKGNKDSST